MMKAKKHKTRKPSTVVVQRRIRELADELGRLSKKCDEWKRLAEDLMLSVAWAESRQRRHACFEQDDAKRTAELIEKIREKAKTDPEDVGREE